MAPSTVASSHPPDVMTMPWNHVTSSGLGQSDSVKSQVEKQHRKPTMKSRAVFHSAQTRETTRGTIMRRPTPRMSLPTPQAMACISRSRGLRIIWSF